MSDDRLLPLWARSLGTDPVLTTLAAFPSPGSSTRLAEAYINKPTADKGWIVRLPNGRLAVATVAGAIRTRAPREIERALDLMANYEASKDRVQSAASENRLLDDVGTVLFGPAWQSQMARVLEINDRTVRRWVAGEYPVPDGVWDKLRVLCQTRNEEIRVVLKRISRRRDDFHTVATARS